MNDPFANKGYLTLTGTGAHNLAATPIYGFTTLEDTVIAAITSPPSVGGQSYNAADAELVGLTLPAGLFWPIHATAITLTSGSAIGWIA